MCIRDRDQPDSSDLELWPALDNVYSGDQKYDDRLDRLYHDILQSHHSFVEWAWHNHTSTTYTTDIQSSIANVFSEIDLLHSEEVAMDVDMKRDFIPAYLHQITLLIY